MQNAQPLPGDLRTRYETWKSEGYAKNETLLRRLMAEGQQPQAMVISCCDSRVLPTDIFGADPGDFFVHRNIASLVPPHSADGGQHGTAAALEYGVTALKVAHIIVIGHSKCGGVQGCAQMCQGTAPALEAKDSFVGRWLDVLRPKYAKVADIADPDSQLRAFEHQAVITSLENLMTYPWIAQAVAAGTLSLHGLWNDISEGDLWQYLPDQDGFQPL